MAYIWSFIALYGGIYIYEYNPFIRWFELALLLTLGVVNFIIAVAPKR
jgi:hypothetical protein